VQLQSSQVFDLVLVRLHCCEYIAARVLDGTHEEDQALFAGLVAIHSARGSVGAGSAVLAVGDAAPSVLQPVSDAPPNKDHPFIHSMTTVVCFSVRFLSNAGQACCLRIPGTPKHHLRNCLV